MFYSLVYLLYPFWILFQKKHTGVYNNNTSLKSVITSTDLDTSVSNNNNTNTNTNTDLCYNRWIFTTKKQNNYAGFDLTKNNSFVAENISENPVSYENAELRKIANYFRKLKQLQVLNSPFVSTSCKWKCAKEVLEEKKTEYLRKNDFWETYEDMFF